MTYQEKIDQAAAFIHQQCGRADIAVVLGSGLGDYADQLEGGKTIPYKDIPNFPVSTVEGHAGNWHAGTLFGKRVYLMQGRFHAYEGYSMEEVTMPIRVMARLGVKTLILTNAAGGINTDFPQGCLMLIDDIINLTGRNPLIGPNMKEFGPRFPDMTYALDPKLKALAKETAKKLDIPLQQGVYCGMIGPSYETPAEIRALRILGADAVGMSTVPEIIVGRHCGMQVMGISCITNMAAGILDKELDMYEIIETGKRVKDIFAQLIDGIIAEIR
ncbi:MAG TPA: purine-nucleoside phosphorylase [Candidatus Limiplasma sp.]|nr:purine-nucleoside phosphorylase [Candidatus Limiplasma sp.]